MHSDYAANGSSPQGSWEASRLNPPTPLWGSNGVAFGPDGRLYVAQFLSGRISALDTGSGDVEVVVGRGDPVQSPDDLAFGADGSMYIADLVPGRVWRRSPQGAYTLVSDRVQVPNGITCVGDRLFVNEMKMDGRLLELFTDGREPVVVTEGLAMGNAMQLGPDGCLYYPHMMTGEVWRVPADGGPSEVVARGVHEPVAVRFDQGGVLLALSRGDSGLVTRIDLHGTGSRSLISSGLVGLDNAAFDAENRMFVSSFASGGVTEMHPDGRTREVLPRGLSGPYGVTVDLRGTVYAADHYRLAEPADRAAPGTTDVVTRRLKPFAHGIVADGELLHLTSQYGSVETYDPRDGTTRVRASGLRQPTGVAVAPGGALVVAESGAGRVVSLGEDDAVSVLAEDLRHPVDVAFDTEGRCYVSDDVLGAVLRLDAEGAYPLADGLEGPQGLTVLGERVFTVEAEARRLLGISLETGERRVESEELALGTAPAEQPALFAHGMPGIPRLFAGLTAAPDGSLLLSANGEGTVVRLSPASTGASEE